MGIKVIILTLFVIIVSSIIIIRLIELIYQKNVIGIIICVLLLAFNILGILAIVLRRVVFESSFVILPIERRNFSQKNSFKLDYSKIIEIKLNEVGSNGIFVQNGVGKNVDTIEFVCKDKDRVLINVNYYSCRLKKYIVLESKKRANL